jgi:aminopeptidase
MMIHDETEDNSHMQTQERPNEQVNGHYIEQYIEVLLRVGANLQPGQTLVVTTELVAENLPFIHQLAERAYALGAGNVLINWQDQTLVRLRGLHGDEAALKTGPVWQAREREELSERDAAFLTISASDPGAMAGVEPQRMATMQQASASAFAGYVRRLMANQHVWSIGAIPTTPWARQVFPKLSAEEAVAALWRYILRVARSDTPDPLAAWQEHIQRLATSQQYMNAMRFRRLRYRAPGTELTIELPEGHQWIGGGARTPRGIAFMPNIPTEEVFTLPKKDGVHGTVRSTLPLYARGQLIERLALTFERGRIVDYTAATGEEVLKHIIETDEGSHYLGEVALVPVTSPCNIGTPLYSTLYDENASCHLAIGQAYAECLEGSKELNEEELAARGVNASLAHVDFMIGSDQLDIDGETASGETVPVFRGGNWAPNARG